MNFTKQISKNIVALLLLIAFMLPATIQFFHLFEHHEHIVCNDNSTHIHKSELKCDICHFTLSSYHNDIVYYPDLLVINKPVKNETIFNSLQLHSFTVTNTRLRAPPILS